jgi:heme/copper-type cytochrome/quinol oxidase subunit 4
MNKHNRNIAIFFGLTILAFIVLVGAYMQMRDPEQKEGNNYQLIFGLCIIAILVFCTFIYREYKKVEDKIEELAVKNRVHDMMKEVH